MRKYAAMILFVCLLLPVQVSADNAGVETTALGYYQQDPTVNGDLTDWPSGLTDNAVQEYYSSLTNPTGPDDFSMSFKAYYNPWPTVNKLYIGVTVTDDEERRTPGSGDASWIIDQLEMYIDGNHDHTGSYTYPVDFQQYLFSLDGTAIISGAAEPAGCEWAYTKAGTTYEFEFALTVYDQYDTDVHVLQPGQTIGFDMSWPDQDDSTGDSWISWSPSGGKWNDSSLFGNLNLGAMQDSPPITATGDTWVLFE